MARRKRVHGGGVTGGIVVPGLGFAVFGKDANVRSIKSSAPAVPVRLAVTGWGQRAQYELEIHCHHHEAKMLFFSGRPACIEIVMQGSGPDDWIPVLSPGRVWMIQPIYEFGWDYPVELIVAIREVGDNAISDDGSDMSSFSPYSDYINAP